MYWDEPDVSGETRYIANAVRETLPMLQHADPAKLPAFDIDAIQAAVPATLSVRTIPIHHRRCVPTSPTKPAYRPSPTSCRCAASKEHSMSTPTNPDIPTAEIDEAVAAGHARWVEMRDPDGNRGYVMFVPAAAVGQIIRQKELARLQVIPTRKRDRVLSDLREHANAYPVAGPVLKATADMIAHIERDVRQMATARGVPPLPAVDGTLAKLAQIASTAAEDMRSLAERGAEELRQAREEFHRSAQEWARKRGHTWHR